jgi:hypothetical protein
MIDGTQWIQCKYDFLDFATVPIHNKYLPMPLQQVNKSISWLNGPEPLSVYVRAVIKGLVLSSVCYQQKERAIDRIVGLIFII